MGLSMMDKSKALLAFGVNSKNLIKVPKIMKEALTSLKNDFEEVKEAIGQLKTEWGNFKAHGATCGAQRLEDPVPCYQHIFGAIKYTMP